MAKHSWNPWAELEDFSDLADRILNESVKCRTGCPPDLEKGYVWSPAADVVETAEGFELRLELPGLAIEEIQLEVREDGLWVYGERPTKAPSGAVFHVMERCKGRFARVFPLGSIIDPDSISASLKSGVLMVTLRKREKGNRKIELD